MNPEDTIPKVSIAVPGDWIIFNLQALEDATQVASLIDERISDDQLRAESREDAIGIVSRVGIYATENDVWFAAAYVSEDAEGPVVVSLTATLMRLRVPELHELNPDGPSDEPEVRLGSQDAESIGPAAPAGGVFHDSATTQIVLRAGPAVRVERVASYPMTDELAQEIYTVQYVLPLDEQGLTLTITAISPTIRRKAQIDLVLDEIADTVAVVRH